MSVASGVLPSPWALGLSPADEGRSAADFFDAFPWDGPRVADSDLTSEEFFGAFGEEPEASAPPTLRGYQTVRR